MLICRSQHLCRKTDVQINSLESKLTRLDIDREKGIKDRKLAENEYISDVSEGGMDADEARLKINEARESPQTPELLQAIHKAHAVVMANDKEIKNTEQQRARLHEASSERNTNIASLRAVLEQKTNEVPACLL